MKIRFSSAKEQQPTQDQGLKVLYAPGKRLSFKLRWYLILLAVTSPLLWLAGRALLGAWLIEAPAQLLLPASELRAREPGQVQEILVRPGDRVTAGQPLVRLDNPEWRARLALLADPVPAAVEPDEGLRARERETLQRLLVSAEQRLSQLSGLLAAGAATRGEVQAARDERDRRLREQLQFEQQKPAPANPALQQRDIERAWLQAQLESLTLEAPTAGVVNELLVAEGENVGSGTLLLRLHRLGEAQLWVYIDPRDAAYAVPGQPFELRLPDGSQLPARVLRRLEDSATVPVELQPAFSAPSRSLRVLARVDGEWPEQWQIDRLGLAARFPHRWGAWLRHWFD